MEDLTKIAEITLHHLFLDALKNENYELCANIRDEYKRRLDTHTFCPYAYIIIQRCDKPKHGLLDPADSSYLLLTDLK